MLIVVVLIQKSKSSTSSGFGVGASQTTFGSQGSAGFLYRSTQYIAATFMLVCLLIARNEHKIYTSNNLDVVSNLPYNVISPEQLAQEQTDSDNS